jgi:murein DD-endopeptidase MepM/ murein hydrolase activator NlpD
MPMYVVLVAVFFLSALLVGAFVTFEFARVVVPRRWLTVWWAGHRRRTLRLYGAWFASYAAFIVLGTGPEDLSLYPPRETSAYRLPWRAGVSRLVAQGNRSFASHRGGHLRAWDFWMPIGTDVLAARAGKVVEVEDRLDGIGLRSNFVTVEHDDGTRAIYAHVRRGSATVRVGDDVLRGQVIAASGMVGQTVFPHLHFVVTTHDGAASLPISFADVPEGVPLAGHWYTSANGAF